MPHFHLKTQMPHIPLQISPGTELRKDKVKSQLKINGENDCQRVSENYFAMGSMLTLRSWITSQRKLTVHQFG